MHILLVGTGAVGMWVGANLLCADHVVRFVGRERFCDAARADGLHVQLPNGVRWHFNDIPSFTSVRDAVHDFDAKLVIACMKAYSVADAVAELKGSADYLRNAWFVPFQNGVGSDEIFASAFGVDRVMAGTLTTPVSIDAPNMVCMERQRGGVGLAPALTPVAGANAIDVATAFKKAPLLRAKLFADARSLRWSKLLLNIVGNATSAITGLSVKDIYEHPIWSKVELGMLRECVSVIDAQAIRLIDLPGAPAAWLARAIRMLPDALLQPILRRTFARARGGKWPSFYYDVANHTGRSEVTYLNGAIAGAAEKLGCTTPINRMQTDVLMQLVHPHATLTREQAMMQLARQAG
jgi:2-dehydropantoate 2-reductase